MTTPFLIIEGSVTAVVMLEYACCERNYSFLVFLTLHIQIPLRLRIPVLVLCPERILK